MKKYFVMLTVLLAVSALALLAADIDGTWTATTQGKAGPQTQTLTLLAKGKTLTGKMDGGRGGATDISEGTIDGNNVAFKVVRDVQGKSFGQEFKGTLAGSELKLSVSGGRGGPVEMVFKKQ